MAHHVTIEGSITPSVELAQGVRRTVAVTDHIRKLVKIGAVIVVAGSLDEPAAAAGIAERVHAPGDDPILSRMDDSAYPPDATPLEPAEPAPEYPPHRNASRDAWAAFLDSQEPPIEFPDDAHRDDLIELWDQYVDDEG